MLAKLPPGHIMAAQVGSYDLSLCKRFTMLQLCFLLAQAPGDMQGSLPYLLHSIASPD